MSSPKHLARIAGVFYLLVGIFGGFSEGFVDPKLHVAGNATATAANVVANSDLVRMGVVAHLATSLACYARATIPGRLRARATIPTTLTTASTGTAAFAARGGSTSSKNGTGSPHSA
jgi:hypothetical protein